MLEKFPIPIYYSYLIISKSDFSIYISHLHNLFVNIEMHKGQGRCMSKCAHISSYAATNSTFAAISGRFMLGIQLRHGMVV